MSVSRSVLEPLTYRTSILHNEDGQNGGDYILITLHGDASGPSLRIKDVRSDYIFLLRPFGCMHPGEFGVESVFISA
jgi:hypothetical protein